MLVLGRCRVWSGGGGWSRAESTLAERMRVAAGSSKADPDAEYKHRAEAELDEKGEQFREPFLMPHRKLAAQIAIEKLTGRAPPSLPRSPLHYHATDVVRRPRCEEMSTDQDWPSVWPVAASFRSSVVPLPVRMGTRPHPERRPPYKTVGNLELVKIPNFLHLTPAAIERHCNAIKKFCTEYPTELKDATSLKGAGLPLTFSYSDYVHQGPSLRDPRSRVVTLRVALSSLRLSRAARDKFVRLAGNRYCEATDTLTVVVDRCPYRKQNNDYAAYLLTALFFESNKVESWEKMAQRADDLKVRFADSSSEANVRKTLAAGENAPEAQGADSRRLPTGEDAERKIKQFAEIWEKCHNERETPETVREYKERVVSLLGIEPLDSASTPSSETTK